MTNNEETNIEDMRKTRNSLKEEKKHISGNIKHYEDILEKMKIVYDLSGTPEQMETGLASTYKGIVKVLKKQHDLIDRRTNPLKFF